MFTKQLQLEHESRIGLSVHNSFSVEGHNNALLEHLVLGFGTPPKDHLGCAGAGLLLASSNSCAVTICFIMLHVLVIASRTWVGA